MKNQFAHNRRRIMKKLHSMEGFLADIITRFSGSMIFVYFHVVWFGAWLLLNLGLLSPFIPVFDPYPYGLLTMIVSLEAIFLSTFIMVAHNRQTLLDEYRDLEENIEEEEVEKQVEDIQQDLDDLKRSISQIEKKILSNGNR